jgi:hypothetical protein
MRRPLAMLAFGVCLVLSACSPPDSEQVSGAVASREGASEQTQAKPGA